ncbi:MAG: hypothetical protein HYX94_09345 [Chloroflexi bacterium]|nr:hypothetical protein [Chloroflexota bacterium]
MEKSQIVEQAGMCSQNADATPDTDGPNQRRRWQKPTVTRIEIKRSENGPAVQFDALAGYS